MKIRILAAAGAVALALSGCQLLGISTDDSEAARKEGQRIVTVAQLGVGLAKVGFNSACHAANSPCSAELTAKGDAAFQVLEAALADAQVALADGLSDAERIDAAVTGVVNAIAAVNAVLSEAGVPQQAINVEGWGDVLAA